MAALKLTEAAKLADNDFKRAIIELYSGSSSILANLPFQNIKGNALKYNREANYPGIGFRGVNEAYTPSMGVLNPITEVLVIAGGELDVDKFIVDTMGQEQRAVQEAMKVRALSLAWTNKFINGNNASDPREFDGLQIRTVGDQVISAGSTANGAALSLAKMDQAIDQTLNPTHIIMNKAMARRFAQAGRATSVSGYVQWEPNELGQRIMMYNGLPIITVDLDNNGSAILGFDEAAASGTDTATSIYIVSMGPDGLTGLQNGGIDVRDLGELETQPVLRTRVEWYNGIAVFNGRAVTRLQHIGDAAIVA
jgi:hypothetical protein